MTAIFLNIFVGDQHMAIVLSGTIFREEFKKRNIAPQMLSRQIEDTATMTSPLVPWNTCGAYMAATLGVATSAYLPSKPERIEHYGVSGYNVTPTDEA